jgi:hypothetical protein
LRRNCQQGDESFVLEVADKLTDSYDRHDAGTSARDIGERLKSSELLIWVYEQTPCSFCRNIALTALIEMGSASADILKEALLDCVEDSRLNAADALAQQGSND